MTRRLVVRSLVSMLCVFTVLLATSCASARRQVGPPGVPIDERPTPPQPPPDSTTAMVPKTEEAPAEREPSPPPTTKETASTPAAPAPPVQTVMSAEERKASLQRIVADTTAASTAVQRCVGKTLLPDQESVFETTRNYLVQTRAAITRGEFWSAEGLARKARQLALSLDCR